MLPKPSYIISKDNKQQDCSYDMYRHATRADSAELAAEKNCRPATAKKSIWMVFG